MYIIKNGGIELDVVQVSQVYVIDKDQSIIGSKEV